MPRRGTLRCPARRALTPLLLAGALAAAVAEPGRADAQRVAPHLWWNDADVVAALDLDAETRAAMDRAYDRHAVDGSGAALRTARASFRDALIEGDWDRAETALEVVARPTLEEGRLKIAVLKLLSPEQHRVLVTRFPTFIRRKWKPAADWVASGAQPRPRGAAERVRSTR